MLRAHVGGTHVHTALVLVAFHIPILVLIRVLLIQNPEPGIERAWVQSFGIEVRWAGTNPSIQPPFQHQLACRHIGGTLFSRSAAACPSQPLSRWSS